MATSKPRRAKKAAATTVADHKAKASAQADDLNLLLERSEQDNESLLNVLEQAQNAQRALVAAQSRLLTRVSRDIAAEIKARAL